MNITNNVTSRLDFLNIHGSVYIKDQNVLFYKGMNCIRVLDLTNAGKAGKVCDEFTVESNSVADLIRRFDVSNLIDSILDCENVSNYPKKGVDTFSPFITHKTHDLQKFDVSKRIPIMTIVKALQNGQFSKVACTGHYTDDYAYDNDTNFGKGVLNQDAILDLCEDITNSRSGWWVIKEPEGTFYLSCHSFLSYRLES